MANGDTIAALAFEKSKLPLSITDLPGTNIRDWGLGVVCV